jgi:hypothetical protein
MLLTIVGKRKSIIISKKGLCGPRLAFTVWAHITKIFEWILVLRTKKGEKGRDNSNGFERPFALHILP